jgi:flagellar protein FlgJ
MKQGYWIAGGAAVAGSLLWALRKKPAMQAVSEGAAKATETVKNIIQQVMHKKEFVKKYHPFAKRAEAITGVPALVTLAQAAIESGWGSKAPGNNFFGHKTGKSWQGERQLLTTTEILPSEDRARYAFPEVLSIEKRTDGKFRWRVKDWFRKYPSPEEAFIAHGNFLKNNKRYAAAFTLREDKAFAAAIHQAGYATDPNYTQKLHALIEDFRKLLQQP